MLSFSFESLLSRNWKSESTILALHKCYLIVQIGQYASISKLFMEKSDKSMMTKLFSDDSVKKQQPQLFYLSSS